MRTKQLGETYLSSVLEMRLKELCETFKSVLELIYCKYYCPLASFDPVWPVCYSDAPVSELSLELLLLQVVLPALLEQGHTRVWLKGLIRGWTVGVAYLLGLRSYLLGDTVIQDGVRSSSMYGCIVLYTEVKRSLNGMKYFIACTLYLCYGIEL